MPATSAMPICWGQSARTSAPTTTASPASTAGKPILGQINSNELTDILIVVVRYYGGVNLGTSGLIVAYREAAADAIAHCQVETRQVEEVVSYSFAYPMMNDVMRIVKDMQPRIVSQTYDNTCEITSEHPKKRGRKTAICRNVVSNKFVVLKKIITFAAANERFGKGRLAE